MQIKAPKSEGSPQVGEENMPAATFSVPMVMFKARPE